MDTTAILTIVLGAFVGFSLGLTGGGGAIFAVPILIYGLGVPAREAVGISLLTVGSTAFVGFLQRARRGMVEFPTGLLFAFAGMIGAPIGSKLADYIPESVLLALFAGLMILIAARMWLKANDKSANQPILDSDNAGPTCRRDPEGRLRLTSQCAMLLGDVAGCRWFERRRLVRDVWSRWRFHHRSRLGLIRMHGHATRDWNIAPHYHSR